MSITDEQLVELMYERRLPKLYREYDKPELPLKRYITALVSGGYDIEVKDTDKILTYIDPEKCEEEYFPFLVESFGLTYYPDIDIKYQRRVVNNIGGLIKRRGTYAGVRFLAKILTGMECDLEYLRGEYFGYQGRFLFVTLLATNIEEVENMDVGALLINRYIKEILPYYITVIARAVIATQSVQFARVRFIQEAQHTYYDMISRELYVDLPSAKLIRFPTYAGHIHQDLK